MLPPINWEEKTLSSGVVVVWTRDEAWGAMRNGTVIEKCNSQPGDSFPDGTRGMIVGSQIIKVEHFYFILWEPMPKVPIAISMHRIRPVKSESSG